jgi:hypothetical protein
MESVADLGNLQIREHGEEIASVHKEATTVGQGLRGGLGAEEEQPGVRGLSWPARRGWMAWLILNKHQYGNGGVLWMSWPEIAGTSSRRSICFCGAIGWTYRQT